MGRLIDADVLKNIIESEKNDNDEMCRICIESTKEIIDAQPTAYDPDKVVARLEAYSNADEAEQLGTIPVVELTDAIEVVKGGGVDETT